MYLHRLWVRHLGGEPDRQKGEVRSVGMARGARGGVQIRCDCLICVRMKKQRQVVRGMARLRGMSEADMPGTDWEVAL